MYVRPHIPLRRLTNTNPFTFPSPILVDCVWQKNAVLLMISTKKETKLGYRAPVTFAQARASLADGRRLLADVYS